MTSGVPRMTAADYKKLAREQECRWHDHPEPVCGNCLECKTANALDAAAQQAEQIEKAIERLKAKAKREGISVRAVILGWCKEWVER